MWGFKKRQEKYRNMFTFHVSQLLNQLTKCQAEFHPLMINPSSSFEAHSFLVMDWPEKSLWTNLIWISNTNRLSVMVSNSIYIKKNVDTSLFSYNLAFEMSQFWPRAHSVPMEPVQKKKEKKKHLGSI